MCSRLPDRFSGFQTIHPQREFYPPDVKISWRHVWIGPAVTAALFGVDKYITSLYLGQTSVASASGPAGSFALLLSWICYSALISFFRAEFTHVYACEFGEGISPKEHARSTGEEEDVNDG